MKRPPRMPNPMAVPSAPMPKMMPTASTVMAWMCATFSIQTLLEKTTKSLCGRRRPPSVMLVGHRQVDDRQHHENERLQRDDQHMERRPDEAENRLRDHAEHGAHGAAHGAEVA